MNLVNTLSRIVIGGEKTSKLQDYSSRFGIELRKVTRMERIRVNELHVMFFNGHQFEVHVIKAHQFLLNEVSRELTANGAVDMNKLGLYL